MIWKMTSLPFEEKRDLDKSSLIHEPFFSSTLGISRNTECHLERKKGSDRFHLLANSSRRFHRVCREDTSLSLFLSLFIYLSLSFRCHGDIVWIKTWHIVEFSSRSMHPGKDSPHAILLGLRASVLRVFLHFGRIPLHPRGTSATLLPDLQWNRSIQTLVFGERNVYTLKKVVWDNEGYSRRETSQDYVNLKMIHLFMR